MTRKTKSVRPALKIAFSAQTLPHVFPQFARMAWFSTQQTTIATLVPIRPSTMPKI